MSAGLLVNQNCTSVAYPKLSANGIPIGAKRKTDSLSSEITNRHLSDNRFQYRILLQLTLQGKDLDISPTLFPNEASLLRLVSAVLMEISEEWETGKLYLNLKE